jgi:hypothetical protein
LRMHFVGFGSKGNVSVNFLPAPAVAISSILRCIAMRPL